MRVLVQRVSNAEIQVDGKTVGKINYGILIFLGIAESDNEALAEKYLEKIKNLRIFEDENHKTNLSIDKINGDVMIVSQFTLYADVKKGNRPDFIKAGNPTKAKIIYDYFVQSAKEKFNYVATGVFGADMKVSLENDGPFTIFLDENIFNRG